MIIRKEFYLAALLLLVLPVTQLMGADSPEFVRNLAGVGAGVAGQTAFRTQIEVRNQGDQEVTGSLSLFLADGSPNHSQVSGEFVGEEGKSNSIENRVEFTVPPGSTLILTVVPVDLGQLGWSRIEADGSLEIGAALQVARLPKNQEESPAEFEHYIEHVSEIEPVEGQRSFVFPIWLFSGAQEVSTAFSVVNLSGAQTNVILTFDGDTRKDVTLAPGQMLADYFDRFWALGFPEVFPFELRAIGQAESSAPLAISVFRTIQGLPVSGVKPSAAMEAKEPTEVSLDQEFDLAVGDRVLVAGEKLQIELWNIVGDSRCPSDVTCVWEGEAIIELVLEAGDGETRRLRISTQDGAVDVNELSIAIVGVQPVPLSEQRIDISEYIITLIVTKK